MSRLVITHKTKVPLISETYNKIGEWQKPGLLVALHWEATNTINFFVSSDGSTFQSFNIGIPYIAAGGNQTPTGGAYSTTLKRYVATTGTTGTSLGLIIYTDNFNNWFTSSTAYSYGTIMTGIDYSPTLDRFVAVGYDKPQYSTNGTSWIKTTSVVNTQWQNVKWISSLSKFFTYLNATLAQSTDGITWTQATSSLIQDIAYSTNIGRLVGIYGSFSRFSFSDNGGSTWTYITQSSASFSNVSWRGVDYSPTLDLFIAVGIRSTIIPGTGYPNNIFATSKTGLTWSVVVGPYDEWTNIRWSPDFERFVMFAGLANYSGSSQYAWTSDGSNWFTSSQYGGNTASGTTIPLINIPYTLI